MRSPALEAAPLFNFHVLLRPGMASFVWPERDDALGSTSLKSRVAPASGLPLARCHPGYRWSGLLVAAVTVTICSCRGPGITERRPALSGVESKAIGVLQREVPKWSRENGCFSCHNNGDAARALFAAVGPTSPRTEGVCPWLRSSARRLQKDRPQTIFQCCFRRDLPAWSE